MPKEYNPGASPKDPVLPPSLLAPLKGTRWSNTNVELLSYFNPEQQRAAPSSTTGAFNMHELVERMMFDATTLVSILENQSSSQAGPATAIDPRAVTHDSDLVSMTAVMRGGSVICGALASLLLVGTYMGGVSLIHPLIGILLIVASFGFYFMSFLKRMT